MGELICNAGNWWWAMWASSKNYMWTWLHAGRYHANTIQATAIVCVYNYRLKVTLVAVLFHAFRPVYRYSPDFTGSLPFRTDEFFQINAGFCQILHIYFFMQFSPELRNPLLACWLVGALFLAARAFFLKFRVQTWVGEKDELSEPKILTWRLNTRKRNLSQLIL